MNIFSRKSKNRIPLSIVGKNWLPFLVFGFILAILGTLAISSASFFTVLSVIFLGVVLFIAGIILIIDTFSFWWHKWPGFFLHLIMGLLYFVVGATLVESPVASSISLTLLLGIFYLIVGLTRVIYALSLQLPQWGWSFFNGLLALLLGVLILANWPASGLFIIGLFIGIDLLVCGFAYIMMAMAAKAHA